ncbi:hypothetical protein [Motilimonas eburnea]|uniref:hypothetical protein n=1 Tax=Motilimonas eburnea TaxID=1737488 RepID=UPI001E3CEC56|nr:hypothetical protein [Motilimonas eburnea]MCE2571792.1 hypothetical protein [Motilimonas eburnea]
MSYVHKRTDLSSIQYRASSCKSSVKSLTALPVCLLLFSTVFLVLGLAYKFGPERLLSFDTSPVASMHKMAIADLVGSWSNHEDNSDWFTLQNNGSLTYIVEGAHRSAVIDFDGYELTISTSSRIRHFVVSPDGSLLENVKGYGLVKSYTKK